MGMESEEYRERHRKVALYLWFAIPRINSLRSRDMLDEANKELACAAVDVMWLADGNSLPEEYYDSDFMHDTAQASPSVHDGGGTGHEGREGVGFRVIQGGAI